MTSETPFTFSPDDLRVPVETTISIARGSFRQHLGQQWCRNNGLVMADHVNINVSPARWLTLCDVYHDFAAGALAYEPVLLESLPRLDAPPDRPVDSLK